MANIMEIEIGGAVHKFKAGFKFIRAAEPIRKQKQNGTEEDVGLNYLLYSMSDGDVDALATTLYLMNSEDENRLKKSDIEAFIEDECEDVDALFAQVDDFLSRSNCTKQKTQRVKENLDLMRARQKQALSSLGATSTDNA